MSVTPHDIGTFIDSKAGKVRTTSAIIGRLIEETVELGLADNMTAGQIIGHVMDSLHNQALKASARENSTIFPSQVKSDGEGIGAEMADIGLIMKDLAYVAGVDQDLEETKKFQKFIKKDFRIADNGTIYAKKAHIKG